MSKNTSLLTFTAAQIQAMPEATAQAIIAAANAEQERAHQYATLGMVLGQFSYCHTLSGGSQVGLFLAKRPAEITSSACTYRRTALGAISFLGCVGSYTYLVLHGHSQAAGIVLGAGALATVGRLISVRL